MKTLSYIRGAITKITIGETYYLGQLWNGDGEGDELLDSKAVSPNGETIVEFEILNKSEDILDTEVKVVSIY